MRVYLAAAWDRKDEIKKVAEELIALGVNVQTRWLDEPVGMATMATQTEFLRSRAEIDVDDVNNCDVLVRFADDLSAPTVPSRLASGARMFEMGLAWARGAEVIVVGGHQCVFDYLGDIVHLPDVESLKTALVGESI